MNINQNFSAVDIAWLKHCMANQNLIELIKQIKLIICDVDGTLTNSHVYVSPAGEGGRLFSTQDGFIVKPALRAGFFIALMSGKDNQSTIQRGKKLGIPEEFLIVGLESKPESVRQAQKRAGVGSTETLIIGDDFLDAEVKISGTANIYACPANTIFYLQPLADIVLPRDGGAGAFRLLMDLILFVHGKHFAQDLIEKVVR